MILTPEETHTLCQRYGGQIEALVV
jgi:hypothetical protein